jgi:hypothetical protein
MVAQLNTFFKRALACVPKRTHAIEVHCDECNAIIADGAIRVWVEAQTFCQECGWKDSDADDFWTDALFNEIREQDHCHAPSFDEAYWEAM